MQDVALLISYERVRVWGRGGGQWPLVAVRRVATGTELRGPARLPGPPDRSPSGSSPGPFAARSVEAAEDLSADLWSVRCGAENRKHHDLNLLSFSVALDSHSVKWTLSHDSAVPPMPRLCRSRMNSASSSASSASSSSSMTFEMHWALALPARICAKSPSMRGSS